MAPTHPPLSQRRNAEAMVAAALAARKMGDMAFAEQLLQQALEIQSDNADALQLLGLFAKGRGDLAGAEQLMRRSLAANKRQPHVHHNLALLLRGRGDLEGALDHARQAARLDSNYIDALILCGELLSALERFNEAEQPLRRAFYLRPDHVSARVSLAYLCTQIGKLDEAEKLLRDGIAKQPDNPFYRNNLGQLLTHRQRYAEAVEIMQPLVQLAPTTAEVFLNLGNGLLGAGRLQDAVNHYLKAIELNPLLYHAHANLNELLWQMGRKEDVGKSYVFAKGRLADNPDILEMSAESAIAFKNIEDAERDLAAAASLRPNSMAQYRLWTALRLAQGRPAEAIELAAAGLRREPDSLDLLTKLAEAQLQRDMPEGALATARRMAEIDPINQYAAYFEANCLRLLGDEEGKRRLYDYDRFVHAVQLEPPVDLALLAEKLDALHQAEHEPVYQTLRLGTQTHESLFNRPGIDPMIAALGENILAAAARFMAALPDDPTHPFLRRKGKGMSWSGSWSVRLREGGHHVDHIHHKGWISGCYYVELPPCLADEEGKPGWIKFGEFTRQAGRSLTWEKAIRPRPGLVVFFPSYMSHGTLPTRGAETRLTVAFDIVPA